MPCATEYMSGHRTDKATADDERINWCRKWRVRRVQTLFKPLDGGGEFT